ncbi:MAG: hypothetical protein MR971_07830 [Bacteroidales bacterium]|nr:hypothetical protein [Bacteroidales bacterium]
MTSREDANAPSFFRILKGWLLLIATSEFPRALPEFLFALPAFFSRRPGKKKNAIGTKDLTRDFRNCRRMTLLIFSFAHKSFILKRNGP